jgi:putative protease
MPVSPLPPTLRPVVRRRPEVLAPAGDVTTLRVALAEGADAVYLGLDEGFNARARARNFSIETLAETVALAHRAGTRVYVTLNVVVFEVELEAVAEVIAQVAEAGVDAIIVQDPAVALLARAICPALEIHASTQMTISSAEAARFAETLGVTRVVVPRELSVSEIARFAEGTALELEVFIHGALCMAWSGQCLSSEAWGGRSANRGQCAQACRMPYDLIVDDEVVPTGDVRYLLSPRDLAGLRAVPGLMQIGVHTLKIEGRLKGPAYVATSVRGLRRWVDALAAEQGESADVQQQLSEDLAAMMVAYSRGFSDGFLAGADHQTLVEGRFPKHRGYLLGRVTRVEGDSVYVRHEERPVRAAHGEVSSPLPALGGDPRSSIGAREAGFAPIAGMGVVFDQGHPEMPDEPGGPIFAVSETRDGWRLTFGRPGPDLARVRVDDLVWLNSDGRQTRDALKSIEREPEGRLGVRVRVSGRVGEPLRAEFVHRQIRAEGSTDQLLAASTGEGLSVATLREKLCGFGGTPWSVASIDASELDPGLHLAVSQLKALRRALVGTLDDGFAAAGRRIVDRDAAKRILAARKAVASVATRPELVVLCRTDDQLDAAIEAGLRHVELDWMEMTGLGRAVARARAAGMRVTIATVRVQKPGEEGFDRRIANLAPDAVLVRHWGGLMHFANRAKSGGGPDVHGDFSLNVTNSITANHLLGLGLDSITAAHDLDETQLFSMIGAVPAARVTVVVHHHIPTFHTEHCVYSHMLSEGRDYRTCGRPCERHRVKLRDHLGMEHPVIVDVGCRNTVFNARAQSAASLVPRLARVEFVWESRAEARRVIDGYMALLDETISAQQLLARVGVHEQFGVTLGTMQTLR